jgi:hypothetical protein
VRKYYYIDYPIFVNLVKWGIAEMRKTIDDKVRNVCSYPSSTVDYDISYKALFDTEGTSTQRLYLPELSFEVYNVRRRSVIRSIPQWFFLRGLWYGGNR